MSVVRLTIDGQQLLTLTRNDTSHEFLKLFLVRGSDEALPPFHREDDLNVDLAVGVSHRLFRPNVSMVDRDNSVMTRDSVNESKG